MLEGVNILANAVKGTLGPQGRNVVLERSFGAPTVTKDGVSVAKEIELKDKLQNMGTQLVKEVASKTSDNAGDGTTTATVLAQAIAREGFKYVAAGMNPMDLPPRVYVNEAVEEGVVAGGGVALLRARQAVGTLKGDNADQDAGIKLVMKAVESPLREIVANCGDEPSVVVNAVLAGKGNYGRI